MNTKALRNEIQVYHTYYLSTHYNMFKQTNGQILSDHPLGVAFDVRKLSVGDFVWIARERIATQPGIPVY